ncbi:hypothetical protein CI793_09620 [Anoxybacillus ayderensis]|uniref:hypothetical protein n=1 Tax=Anoxybacillus sp. ST70 TaxID=2864180 RepID=UPI0002F8838A|nr:hypothetical protein [Anoxybacillus sp. ST70]AXM89396.1 hypothetical protein B379_09785 [Anoxybacillus ayderensis G10]MBW9219418.1 hypothetical protein [Anoxybacillus sp. ST70]THD16157.1 hypothetical protein CI793_09620 [Anoxybacillus ayderensis]
MGKIKYNLETKDDFIDYLGLIIEQVQKQMWRYRRYLSEVEDLCRTKIKEYDSEINEVSLETIIKVLNDPLYMQNRAKIKPIPFYKYAEIRDKLEFVNLRLLNLIGDKTKEAVSYAKFRKTAEKLEERLLKEGKESIIQLDNLSTDIQQKINECYKARNYVAHWADTKFIAQKEYRTSQLKEFEQIFEVDFINSHKHIIMVNRYEYVDIEWLFELYVAYKKNQKIYSSIFQQMRRDYTKMVGKPTEITPIQGKVLPFNFSLISQQSVDMQFKKDK